MHCSLYHSPLMVFDVLALACHVKWVAFIIWKYFGQVVQAFDLASRGQFKFYHRQNTAMFSLLKLFCSRNLLTCTTLMGTLQICGQWGKAALVNFFTVHKHLESVFHRLSKTTLSPLAFPLATGVSKEWNLKWNNRKILTEEKQYKRKEHSN